MPLRAFLSCAAIAVLSSAFGATPSGSAPNVVISTDTLDSGGGRAASSACDHIGSVGLIAGTATAGELTADHGYVAQVSGAFAAPAIAWGAGTTGHSAGDTGPLNWDLGTVAPGTVRTTNTGGTDNLRMVLWNTGNCNEQVFFAIPSAGPWQPAAQAGVDKFVFGVNQADDANFSIVVGPLLFISAFAPGATQDVKLLFQAPTGTSTFAPQLVFAQITIVAE